MSVSKDLIGLLKENDRKGTQGYDTQAEVLRVEGDTVWVKIPGGVPETPAQKTINAVEGDTVQVRVAGGNAWLVGNASAPPTDDATALMALESASIAKTAADNAVQSAATAEQAAQEATATAESVRGIAEQAQVEAEAASTAAQAAQSSATAAGTAAASAQNSATNALNQLSYVENVVGVLNWIAEHGTYKVTTDAEVAQGKLYFTRTGSGTEADPYVYTVVTNPTGNPSTQGWYELDSVDEAISNFITTHVVLLDDGLYITSDTSGYKVRIDNDSVDIINPSGEVVSTFSTSIKIGQRSAAFVLVSSDGISMNGGQSEAVCFKIKTTGTISYASTEIIKYPVVATTEIISGKDALVVSTDNPFNLIYNGATYTFTSFGTHDVGGFAEIILTATSYDAHYYEPSRERRAVKVEYTRRKFRGYFRLGPIVDRVDTEGMNSATIGVNPTVQGDNSLSVGSGADAQSDNSGAFGHATQTLYRNQFAVGQGNDASNSKVLFMVGNSRGPYTAMYTDGLEEPYDALSDANRSNAFTVDIDGNIEAAGDVTDGSGNVLADKVDTSALATVATTGDYDDLSNTPTIPTKTSDLTNDSDFKSITFPYTGGSPENEVTSLATSTWTVVGNITLDKGTHLLTVKARTQSNATGRRTMLLSSNNNADGTGALSVMASDHRAAVNGDYTDLLINLIVMVPADNTKQYIKIMQNSGSTLTCNTRVSDVLFG